MYLTIITCIIFCASVLCYSAEMRQMRNRVAAAMRLVDMDKEAYEKLYGALESRVGTLEAQIGTLEKRIRELESGNSPDYEKSVEAARAVNNFNSGITAILGYDPFAALDAERKKEKSGGDVQ